MTRDHQTRQDRYDEAAYEAQRVEREVAKAAREAEKARIKAHGLVRTIQSRKARRWGSSADFTHRCPACGRRADMNTFSAVCTGRRIRKERRDPATGRSVDFPGGLK